MWGTDKVRSIGTSAKAMEQGFLPDTISSDLHSHNVEGPVFDLITTVTNSFARDVAARCAEASNRRIRPSTLGMPGRIGTLAAGAEGDAVVLDPQEGRFDLVDSHGVVRQSPMKLVPTTVVKGGRVDPHRSLNAASLESSPGESGCQCR